MVSKMMGENFIRFTTKMRVNTTPKAIHIAKSLEKPSAQTKTCQKVCLYQHMAKIKNIANLKDK